MLIKRTEGLIKFHFRDKGFSIFFDQKEEKRNNFFFFKVPGKLAIKMFPTI